jgi:hypothetical protein
MLRQYLAPASAGVRIFALTHFTIAGLISSSGLFRRLSGSGELAGTVILTGVRIVI